MSPSSTSELFDSIIDQLLSGVRHDDIRISFGDKTDNDVVYNTARMRENFVEFVNEYKSQLCVDRGQTRDEGYDLAISEVMSTIPILWTCIHKDDVEYFEKEIVDYVLAHYRNM